MANDLAACIANVAKELELPEKDVREIAERLKREKARLAADGQITRADDALAKFAQGEADKIRIAAALQRKQAALNVILRDEWDSGADAMVGAGMRRDQAILAHLVGTSRGVAGGRKSVAARRIALESDWLGGLLKDVQADPDTAHAVALLKNPKAAAPFFANVVREMRELREGGTPGRTGDKAAQKVAKVFANYAEASRLEANRSGANIGKLDGWSPQSHDARKVMRVGGDKWLADIMPLLDHERSFAGASPEDVRRILLEVHDNIVFGKDAALSPAARGDRVGPANFARSLEKHRVLHFKDADAWLAYADKYGRGHVATAMLDHLHHMARKVSVMQTLGPNPQVFLDAFIKGQMSKARGEAAAGNQRAATALDRLGKVNLNESTRGPIAQAYAEVTGGTFGAVNLTAAHIGAGIRAVESMGKLGFAPVSSVTDLVTFAHAMRFQGKNIVQGYADGFHALLAGRQGHEQKQLALMLGVFHDSILGDIHSRYQAEDNVPGKMSRAMATFFKLSGLNWWTDRLTNAFARMSSAFMADHAHLPLAELDDAYRHVLALHGLDGARWDVARQAVHKAEDGTRYIVPEKVRELPDAAFAGLTRDGSPVQTERARRELEWDMRSFFADEANYAVLKADDRTRMFAVRGTKPGTTLGEAMRFVTQFKSFPIAYVQRSLERTMRGGPGGKADYVALGELIAMSTLFGYGAMTAKDFLKNKTPRDPTNWKTMLAAMQQGGGIGIYGDFLFSAQDRMGGSPLETLLGPTYGTASSLAKLLLDIRDNAKSKKDEAAGTIIAHKTKADAFQFALNNTPYINLWYTRAALDLAILNSFQEYMSPGTFHRREKQMQTDYGQSYLTPPLSHSIAGPHG